MHSGGSSGHGISRVQKPFGLCTRLAQGRGPWCWLTGAEESEMSFVQGLSLRPEGAMPSAASLKRRSYLVGALLSAGAVACSAESASATMLTVGQFMVAQASGTPLPMNFPATMSAGVSPTADAATFQGSIGPITRPAWADSGLGTLRMQISGQVLDGVVSGDEVNFNFALLIQITRGSLTWNVRGTANVPPAQGFLDGLNGTVQANNGEPTMVSGSFGKMFSFNSTSDGTYSMYIDLTWNNAGPPETLSISVLYATVHLPAPGMTAFGIGLAGMAARRRRPGSLGSA